MTDPGRPPRSRLHSRLLPLAVLGLALGLGACGGSDRSVAGIDLSMKSAPADLVMPEDIFPPEDLPPSIDMAFPEDMAAACVVNEPKPGMVPAKTGQKCDKNTDCKAGAGPMQPGVCLHMDSISGTAVTFPNGYCSSACRVAMNGAGMGLNPDCPGGNATCLGATPMDDIGKCYSFCTTDTNCRPCYGCFQVSDTTAACLPAALSQCDASKTTSCPFSGGKPQACGPAGPDPYMGSCGGTCDPFKGGGCPVMKGGKGDCHINEYTTQGFCTNPNPSPANAGEACGNYYNDCRSGYGCLNGLCWKYCNDANYTTQCVQGAHCTPFVKGVMDTARAGICSESK